MNAATPAAAPTPPTATPTTSAMGGPAGPTTSVNESVSAVRRAVPFRSSAMNLYVWLPAGGGTGSREDGRAVHRRRWWRFPDVVFLNERCRRGEAIERSDADRDVLLLRNDERPLGLRRVVQGEENVRCAVEGAHIIALDRAQRLRVRLCGPREGDCVPDAPWHCGSHRHGRRGGGFSPPHDAPGLGESAGRVARRGGPPGGGPRGK